MTIDCARSTFAAMNRIDGRRDDELRPVAFDLGIAPYAGGSVLVAMGNTRVICGVTIEENVPRWMKEQGVASGCRSRKAGATHGLGGLRRLASRWRYAHSSNYRGQPSCRNGLPEACEGKKDRCAAGAKIGRCSKRWCSRWAGDRRS